MLPKKGIWVSRFRVFRWFFLYRLRSAQVKKREKLKCKESFHLLANFVSHTHIQVSLRKVHTPNGTVYPTYTFFIPAPANGKGLVKLAFQKFNISNKTGGILYLIVASGRKGLDKL